MIYPVTAQWDDYDNYDNGSFRDERDGQEYDWVKIGKQIWMADNLNVGKIIYVIDGKITAEYSIEKLCYEDKEENCKLYGGLYRNEVIEQSINEKGHQSICPNGWHLPNQYEWKALFNYLGGEEVAGAAMKETGIKNWKKKNKDATNSSGFTALPGGYCLFNYYDEATFADIGRMCCFWSSSDWITIAFLVPNFCTFCLTKNKTKIVADKSYGKSAHSVRCVKDSW